MLFDVFNQRRKTILTVSKSGEFDSELRLYFRKRHGTEGNLFLWICRFLRRLRLTGSSSDRRFFAPGRLLALVALVALVAARFALVAGFIAAWAALGKLMLRWRRLARRLDAAQRAAQFLDLTLIGQFLPFGNLDELENFIQLINHAFQRFGNVRGMFNGLTNGRGFGGTKIGGFDPRFRARWFRPAFGRTRTYRLLARAFGTLISFRMFAALRFHGRHIFSNRFWFGVIGWFRGVRSKFRRLLRVRRAESALVIRFVLFVGRGIHWFGSRSLRFKIFRRHRSFLGSRRERLGRTGARATATATATASAAVDGTAGGGGQVQIRMFVRHKISVRMAAGRANAMAKWSLFYEKCGGGGEAVQEIFFAHGSDFAVAEEARDAGRAKMRLQQLRIVAGPAKEIFAPAVAAKQCAAINFPTVQPVFFARQQLVQILRGGGGIAALKLHRLAHARQGGDGEHAGLRIAAE